MTEPTSGEFVDAQGRTVKWHDEKHVMSEERVLAAVGRAESMAAEADLKRMMFTGGYDRMVKEQASEPELLKPFRPTLAEQAARIERDWEERRRVSLIQSHLGGVDAPREAMLALYDAIKADVPPTTCSCGLCQPKPLAQVFAEEDE